MAETQAEERMMEDDAELWHAVLLIHIHYMDRDNYNCSRIDDHEVVSAASREDLAAVCAEHIMRVNASRRESNDPDWYREIEICLVAGPEGRIEAEDLLANHEGLTADITQTEYELLLKSVTISPRWNPYRDEFDKFVAAHPGIDDDRQAKIKAETDQKAADDAAKKGARDRAEYQRLKELYGGEG